MTEWASLIDHVKHDRVDDMVRCIQPQYLTPDGVRMNLYDVIYVAMEKNSPNCLKWLLLHGETTLAFKEWLYNKLRFSLGDGIARIIIEYGKGMSLEGMERNYIVSLRVKTLFEARDLRRDRQRALLAGLRSVGASKDLIRMFEAAIKNIC